MADPITGGAAIAWRLLATLEGGSLLLAASALLAYAARTKLATDKKVRRRPVKRVLVTNPNSTLGKEIITRLELRGCEVSTLTSAEGDEVISGSDNEVDALIVIGATIKVEGLDGMAGLVSEDVYCNLKLLESLSSRLSCGGRILWASASLDYNNNDSHNATGVYAAAVQAYDSVLQATLQHVAKVAHCDPIWIDRCFTSQETAERTVAALINDNTSESQSRIAISFRNSVKTISGFFTRWTKSTNR